MLTLLLSAILLSSCSGGDDTSETPGDSTPAAPDDTAPSDTSSTGDDTAPDDTDLGGDDTAPIEYVDPIEIVGYDAASIGEESTFYELLDGEVLSDTRALMVGQGGGVLVSLPDGAILDRWYDPHHESRGSHASLDPSTGLLWVAPRNYPLFQLEVQGDEIVNHAPLPMGELTVDDIAADGGYALLAARTDGALLVDGAGAPVATLPAADAVAVGLSGDRAVVVDVDVAILWDVSDRSNPTELDRLKLSAQGRDVAFDGRDLAIALGSSGAAALRVESDALVARGEFDAGGACFGVALDDGALWMAAWDQIALAYLDAEPPLLAGSEQLPSLTLGVAAGEGYALSASWTYAITFQSVEGPPGPEVEMDPIVSGPVGTTDPIPVTVSNRGPATLQVQFEPADGWDGAEVELEQGESEAVFYTPPAPFEEEFDLRWSSNDPDELDGKVRLRPADAAMGQPHPEVTLNGFSWPDGEIRSYTIGGEASDYAGEVVFLAYFTTW